MSAASSFPTLELERQMLEAGHSLVVGVDEVGRGAIAGPVAVGAFLLTAEQVREGSVPEGLKDSKLLSEKRREELLPRVQQWSAGEVGMASAQEIEQHGISHALSLAASRALAELPLTPEQWGAAAIIVDGKVNWVAPGTAGQPTSAAHVLTRVKADRNCAVVAAASVLAKVTRDRLMLRLAARYPGYSWESNKGYGAAAHYAGIAERGTTVYHRESWIKQGTLKA